MRVENMESQNEVDAYRGGLRRAGLALAQLMKRITASAARELAVDQRTDEMMNAVRTVQAPCGGRLCTSLTLTGAGLDTLTIP